MTALNWGFIGHARSGKSADMAYWSMQHVARGGGLYRFPGFEMRDPGTGLPIGKSIDMMEFVQLFERESCLKNCMVDIDEIQNFLSSDQFMALYNRVISRMSAQAGKLKFGIAYTTQSWSWVDPRLRQLTALLSVCRDMYHTPFGKQNGIKRGELMSVNTYDCWGYITGQEWAKLRSYVLDIRVIRNYYEADTTVDPLEAFRKLEIKKQVNKLDLSTGQPRWNPVDEDALKDVPDDLAEVSRQSNLELIDSLAAKGVDIATLRAVAGMARKDRNDRRGTDSSST